MDDDERRELVRGLFYLMTTLAEDAAAIAVAGQANSTAAASLLGQAEHLGSMGKQIEILARAASALLRNGHEPE